MAELLTQKQIAEWLNLSPRQIHNLVDEGLPSSMAGTKRVYPWPAGLQWYLQYKIAAALKSQSSAGGDDVAELRRRENAARADKAETDAEMARLALAEKRGLLMAVDDSAMLVEGMLAVLNAGLGNFAGRWAPDLVGLDTTQAVRAKLDPAIDELRASLCAAAEERLSEGLPASADGAGGGAGAEEDDGDGGDTG